MKAVQPPPCDELEGILLPLAGDERAVLVVGRLQPLPSDSLATGWLAIRYGIAFLYELDFLLPQWLYDDFRREHHGAEALDFMLRRGDAFPRADVVGQRVSTGKQAEVFLKQLDLARGIQAFAYAPPDAPLPLARLALALWIDDSLSGWEPLPDDDECAPALLRQGAPCCAVNPALLADRAALLAAIVPSG